MSRSARVIREKLHEFVLFFGHFKTDVRGTHHSISKRWLHSYLNEWVWKWNRRDDDEAMFRQLLSSAAA